MKEIKTTKTVEEVIGYEAGDGMRFTSKAECEKYEGSARYAARKVFESICVKQFDDGDVYLNESYMFDPCLYGGFNDENLYVIADIKTERELNIALMFRKLWTMDLGSAEPTTDMIGKRVLIYLGAEGWNQCFDVLGTEEQFVGRFAKCMAGFFHADEVEK